MKIRGRVGVVHNMRILVVTYKSEISGGSNRSMLSIIDELQKHGHEVILLLPKKKGDLYTEGQKRGIKIIYIPLSRIGVHKQHSKAKNLYNQFVMKMKLIHDRVYIWINKRKLKNLNLDIIYTNGAASHAGRLISKTLRLPHVWHIREYFDDSLLLPQNIYQIMEKDTDKFILISNDLYQEYSRHIAPEKLIMISNGIYYKEAAKKIKHDGVNIIQSGRISESKRQLDALKALKIILTENISIRIHLYFAGKAVDNSDCEYKKFLKSYIEENRLTEYVTFLGDVDNLNEIRRNMDIEIICSLREAFGRVTVEAMRSGLAVIGTNSGGTKDIIQNGVNGLLYEPGNVNSLVERINSLIENPIFMANLSENGKEFSKTNFTEKQFTRVVNLLETIAEKGTVNL